MKAIYEKHNGNIVTIIPNDMDYKLMFIHFNNEFVDNLSEIAIKELPKDYAQTYKYYIRENKMLKYTDNELEEKEIYGRILTVEERVLEEIKPSQDEIKKAEKQLEFIEFIEFMEVLGNE